MTETPSGTAAAPLAPPPPTAADPCLALRLEADGRCQVAEQARRAERDLAARTTAARDEREARRQAVEAAAAAADPAAIRTWRRRARATFVSARGAASSAEAIATAASAWLAEVERLNAVAAETTGRLERERAAEEIAVAVLEHLIAESAAARAAAERAEEACEAARQAAAECAPEEAVPAPAETALPLPAQLAASDTHPIASAVAPAEPDAGPEPSAERVQDDADERHRREIERRRHDALVAHDRETREREDAAASRLQALTIAPAAPLPSAGASADATSTTSGGARSAAASAAATVGGPVGRLTPDSTVNAIMAGDLTALARVAAALSDEPAGRRRWEARVIELLQAILLRAIDAGAVGLPADHPFWGTFTSEQVRDILAALAALGYRLDGLGGWLDGRVPATRELSIAVGHAGLDPMRIRHWPSGQEAAELVRDAEILGAEYLAAVAPTLAAAELTAVLGDQPALVEVWAAWDQVRPLLLAPAPPPPPDAPTRPGWWARLKAGAL